MARDKVRGRCAGPGPRRGYQWPSDRRNRRLGDLPARRAPPGGRPRMTRHWPTLRHSDTPTLARLATLRLLVLHSRPDLDPLGSVSAGFIVTRLRLISRTRIAVACR